MDHRSSVAARPSGNEQAVCGDQAIFTSVRTPTGAGYRIIAASPGLRPDEKMDITRRSPSHGAMCDDSPGAVALAAYPLPSGRFCIADSRYDGNEPSARGGQRIRTHALVIDQTAYQRFGYDLLRAHRALADSIQLTPGTSPPASLPTLAVSPHARTDAVGGCRSAHESAECLLAAVSAILGGRPVVLSGLSSPTAFVGHLINALPFFARRTLAVSVGIKFSLTRQMQLVIIDGKQEETQRAVHGHNVLCLNARTGAAPTKTPAPIWIELVRQCWKVGRGRALDRLTCELEAAMPIEGLERIAAICLDQLGLHRADAGAIEQLLAQYMKHRAKNSLEEHLVAHLLEMARARVAFLAGDPANS